MTFMAPDTAANTSSSEMPKPSSSRDASEDHGPNRWRSSTGTPISSQMTVTGTVYPRSATTSS